MADAARPPEPPPHPPVATGGAPAGYPAPPPYVPPGWSPPPGGWPPPPGYGPGAGWAYPPPGGGAFRGQVGSGRFRSLSVGELLDAIFSLYRRNFLLIAAISAVVQVPYAVVQFVLYELRGISSLVSSPFRGLTPAPGSGQTLTPDQLQTLENALGGIALVVLVLGLLSLFVVLPLAEAATTRAVSDRYLDRDTSLGASYRAAIRRLGALIVQSLILLGGTVVLIAALVLLAFLFGVLGGGLGVLLALLVALGAAALGIFAYVRTSLAAPAIVLEGLSGWAGLVRSWALTRGLGWRLLGIRLLILLITVIVSGVLTTLLSLAGASLDAQGQFVVDEVASAIISVFVGPITYIAVTLLYYDTRIRKEGFDIEMLAQSL